MRVYCDLDGTLIRGDLEREFVGYLQSTGSFTIKNYLLALISIPANKLRRKQERGSIYKSWTFDNSRKNARIDVHTLIVELDGKTGNIQTSFNLMSN